MPRRGGFVPRFRPCRRGAVVFADGVRFAGAPQRSKQVVFGGRVRAFVFADGVPLSLLTGSDSLEPRSAPNKLSLLTGSDSLEPHSAPNKLSLLTGSDSLEPRSAPNKLSLATGSELSSLPPGADLLEPRGDLETSEPCATL